MTLDVLVIHTTSVVHYIFLSTSVLPDLKTVCIQVSLILIDQCHHRHIVQTFRPSHESTSFKRPKADMNVASGYPRFAKRTSYVKDSVMYGRRPT